MSIEGQGHSLTLVKGHSDFKVKCLTFGLYTQVSDSGPLGPLVCYLEDCINNGSNIGAPEPVMVSILTITGSGAPIFE